MRCENCGHFDGDYCMKEWNNAEEDFKVPERDARQPEDYCSDYVEEENGL